MVDVPDRRIELDFDISSSEQRLNSFHKIDTLIRSLQSFRDGLAAEAALYRRRAREADRIESGEGDRHAPFDPAGGDVAAERLDLDRSKPRPLWLHRHPLGQPNEIKEPAENQSLFGWFHKLERLIYEAWLADNA